MIERELRERLAAKPIDSDAEVQERAWRVVRSAYQTKSAFRARSRWRVAVPAVAGLIAVAAIVLATASAPREALARWFRQAIGVTAPLHPRPVLAGLPGGGRLLVNSPVGPWIVHADGSRRYLGRYTAGAWSPHSLYVVAWRGSELAALDPRGHRQWILAGDAPVTLARWSPDGYRIAYIAGGSLWIVAGDGSEKHRLDGRVAPVTPAWQPATAQSHRIAFLDPGGLIELRDADTGALLWRIKPAVAPRQLLWTADGARLLAVATHHLSLYSAGGRQIATGSVPAGETVGPAAVTTGDRLAIIVHHLNQPADSVALVDASRPGLRRTPETVFTAPERLTGIDWSPQHQWLLTSSPSADQWIFIRVSAPTRFTAEGEIANQFGAKGALPPGAPILAGWQP